jgi:hypothetical protein
MITNQRLVVSSVRRSASELNTGGPRRRFAVFVVFSESSAAEEFVIIRLIQRMRWVSFWKCCVAWSAVAGLSLLFVSQTSPIVLTFLTVGDFLLALQKSVLLLLLPLGARLLTLEIGVCAFAF